MFNHVGEMMPGGSTGWNGVIVPALLCAVTLGLFASRRFRADGIAVLALVAAVAAGLVSPDRALSGLSAPVVVTVTALSILASIVHRSGLIDLPRSSVARHWRLTTPVMVVCGVMVAGLAALSGRSGTRLAVASSVTRSQGQAHLTGPARLVLSWACLLGGLVTVVGAVPNLLVSAVRHDLFGAEFPVLAFLPVGAALLGAGLVAFALTAAFIRGDDATLRAQPVDALRRVQSFTNEATVPADSPLVGRHVAGLEAAEGGAMRVLSLVREGYRRLDPRPDWVIEAGDLIVFDCEPAILQQLIERYGLQATTGSLGRPGSLTEAWIVEALVTQGSELIGRTVETSGLHALPAMHLLAIGRNDDHPPGRLRRTRLRAGDILVLGSEGDVAPTTLSGLGCLPLAERRLRAGRGRKVALPIGVLLAALAVAVAGLVPLWLALLGGVLLLWLVRATTLQEMYEVCPWPGLVMLASLLPLAATLHGSAPVLGLAGTLAAHTAQAGPMLTVAATLAAAMAATWLFGSTVAVLLVAPFAAAMAQHAGSLADMLLLAVAVGAAIDLLDERGFVDVIVPAPGAWRLRGLAGRLAASALLFAGGTLAILALGTT